MSPSREAIKKRRQRARALRENPRAYYLKRHERRLKRRAIAPPATDEEIFAAMHVSDDELLAALRF